MTNINIKIPDDVHKRLKIACAVKGISLKEAIIDAIKRKVEDGKSKR